MTRFLNYLHDNGLSNINLLRSEHILSYAASLRDQYARNSDSGILFTLRNFHLYVSEKGLTSRPFYELFPVIYSNKKNKLPSYCYEDEIHKNIVVATIATTNMQNITEYKTKRFSIKKPSHVSSPEQQLKVLAKRLGYSVAKVPDCQDINQSKGSNITVCVV